MRRISPVILLGVTHNRRKLSRSDKTQNGITTAGDTKLASQARNNLYGSRNRLRFFAIF